MDILGRERYELQVSNRLGKGQVVVVTGHRRCGKSMLMARMREKLAPLGNVVYLDMENPDNLHIASCSELNDYLKSALTPDAHNYVLIDEVQEIRGFERVLRYYAKDDNTDIIVTGSNAFMLSSEIATLFAGRNSLVHMYGLDYCEFLQFHRLDDSDTSLSAYMRWGGLPFLHRLPLDDARARQDYLGSIYNTVFVKDIITRNTVRNAVLIDNLARFIADNCGKTFSAHSIANYLKNSDLRVSSGTIADYTSYLCESYLIDKVRRYDIKGKQVFEQQEKYYFQDIGLRNYLCSDKRSPDIEKVMENLVYLKLRQMGYDVFVGSLNGKEIDFVARSGEQTAYYQVSLSVSNPDTYEREYGNLRLIRDNYPKYVITLDPMAGLVQDSGIRTLPLRAFLSAKD